MNAHGGVNGKQINLQTFDYSYEVPRAIAQYKKWKQEGMVALQGWGTADTEALVGFVADDQIPYFSASYSGHLTDPTGKGKETKGTLSCEESSAKGSGFLESSAEEHCRAARDLDVVQAEEPAHDARGHDAAGG